jgi:AcrR family transcriptional regulator
MFSSSNSAAPARATTPKAEATRRRIVEAALGLLEEVGYEGATMRAIARRAGVSIGNAYYYFPSKEHLVQGFYEQMRGELDAAARPILERERALKPRLRGVLHAWLERIDRHHDFAGALFQTAADPASPLNPFSAASGPVREEAIDLYRELVRGTTTKLPAELLEELPILLWTYHMGITLFWIHDDSPDRRRTRLLIDGSVELIAKLIALSRLPGTGGVRRAAKKLFREICAEEIPT